MPDCSAYGDLRVLELKHACAWYRERAYEYACAMKLAIGQCTQECEQCGVDDAAKWCPAVMDDVEGTSSARRPRRF